MQENIIKYQNIIIGGGASGLMCASHIAQSGSTIILESQPQIGSKVRISGGGKCNFTNLGVTANNYLCHNPHFVKSALARFKPEDIIALLNQAHIKYEERQNKQMFAFNAQNITDMLLQNCKNQSVKIQTNVQITNVEKDAKNFIITTNKNIYMAQNLIIATGGLSYPKIGATDFGHKIARQFGHKITNTRPALVGLVSSSDNLKLCENLAGVSTLVNITVGKKELSGNLLFTYTGISGPVVLNTSLYLQDISQIFINFLPDKNFTELLEGQKKQNISTILNNFLPVRLVKLLLGDLDINIDNLSKKNRQLIEDRFTKFAFIPNKTMGYNRAEVTAGGVDVSQISSTTMESKLCPHLYFIGEVLDVAGELGGFNLHWAWASANAVSIEK